MQLTFLTYFSVNLMSFVRRGHARHRGDLQGHRLVVRYGFDKLTVYGFDKLTVYGSKGDCCQQPTYKCQNILSSHTFLLFYYITHKGKKFQCKNTTNKIICKLFSGKIRLSEYNKSLFL